MATISDEAICIRHWDFSETSQTVSLFCREHGIMRGLAKGAKREKGQFSGGIDLLHHGHVVAIVKSTRDLATITEWHLEHVYHALRQHIGANRIALYIADLLHHMLTADDPHPALFDGTVRTLQQLADPVAHGRALLEFQWSLLVECGYRPELERDAETGKPLTGGHTLAFSAGAGGVVADTGTADRWRVRRTTIDMLRQLSVARQSHHGTTALAGAPRAAEPVPDDRHPADTATIERANALLAAYLRNVIGEDLTTMRWLFDQRG